MAARPERDFRVAITSEPLQLEDAVEFVTLPECGGVSVFLGTTRDSFEGKRVVTLQYEAYESMALRQLRRICEEAAARWDVRRVALLHRVGTVPVREASVVVATSAPHRVDAIQATAYCIDEIKASVPVWKTEVYEDGSMWKANREFSHDGKAVLGCCARVPERPCTAGE